MILPHLLGIANSVALPKILDWNNPFLRDARDVEELYTKLCAERMFRGDLDEVRKLKTELLVGWMHRSGALPGWCGTDGYVALFAEVARCAEKTIESVNE